MTEAEWLACTSVDAMLYTFRDRPRDRKLLLFAAACCRRVWGLMTDERSRRLVEVAERHTDGLANDEALAAAGAEGHRAWSEACARFGTFAHPFEPPPEELPGAWALRNSACGAKELGRAVSTAQPGQYGRSVAHAAARECARAVLADYEKSPERPAQCALLRDIFGNPFRPASLQPAWLAPTVTSLAAAAYEERALPSGELDPARLSALADALEDAGCTDTALLGHLRAAGPHVRGCWALDLVLGKQ